ncbi:MAG TPA: NADH-quinone oxidoreductase subunit NuoF [Thermodesulfovibrionales bacterium]|jgi:NADH-quinone oxidoreductase subunit F|nr:NADH-quinone oxidoreductase subunit NuoF [Thermodesulfovibrionales bacterium]
MEKPLTGMMRPDGEALTLEEYEKAGGYEGLRKALKTMTPGDIVQAVKDSNLRGRGGAGFPTGIKWSFMPAGDNVLRPRYLIANADEMEPGTFKDRILIEGNPHQLIEGMIISAYALHVDTAYVFLRWEYRRAAERLSRAIADAYAGNYLGRDILKSGFRLELYLHVSAGRYICGEETAMLNALEGRRPIPRAKPPHPQASGLWGRPTIINNAETLCNIPHIILNGAAWYKGLSHTEEGGTKMYGVSGRVRRPGAWELAMGTTIREIIEEHAGGMADGYRFRAVIPGGASTDFLVEEHLDVRMDYDSVPKVGSRMGTGTMIVLDDRTCPVGMVHNLERFFSRESCGWCTPCREGLPWIEKLLMAIESGEGEPGDIGILESHTGLLGPGHTFCAFAPGAVEPLQSALKYFREDFELHIKEKKCPWK